MISIKSSSIISTSDIVVYFVLVIIAFAFCASWDSKQSLSRYEPQTTTSSIISIISSSIRSSSDTVVYIVLVNDDHLRIRRRAHRVIEAELFSVQTTI